MSEREHPPGDARAQPGFQNEAVEYLQAAAVEAIKAMRSFLDIAESLVREPEMAATMGRAFAEAAAGAVRHARSAAGDPASGDEPADPSGDDEEEPAGRVRRIDLSD